MKNCRFRSRLGWVMDSVFDVEWWLRMMSKSSITAAAFKISQNTFKLLCFKDYNEFHTSFLSWPPVVFVCEVLVLKGTVISLL